MPLETGHLLGPYEILAPLQKSGMSEVYRARDQRLGRTVAVKVSHAAFSDRFEREARTVAGLSHPNICQLFDVGPNYLVMEFVEGGPVGRIESLQKLLDVAVQIADGMAAAHAAGFVHRDLKPDNILVTPDGRVKILDFGLAKPLASPDGSDETRSVDLTQAGTTLGTVPYMSPEQARGQTNLGPQSDQFSFGLVLYEIVTGRRAFRRASAAETRTAIIHEEPEPLPEATPRSLKWVVERLLAKDPADRWESSRDLYRELRQIRDRLSEATASPRGPAPPAPAPALSRWIWPAAVVVAMAGSAALSHWLWPRFRQPDLTPYRFMQLAGGPATEWVGAWSPDGRSLAYVAQAHGGSRVMTCQIGASQPAALTDEAGMAWGTFWAPDGSMVYYTVLPAGGLWAVSAAGGPPERLLDGVITAAVQGDGQTFAIVKDGKLWVVANPRTGDAHPRPFGTVPLGARGELPSRLAFSPDDSKLAVLRNGRDLWILDYPSGRGRKVWASEGPAGSVSWMPDGRHLVVPEAAGPGGRLVMIDATGGRPRTIYSAPGAILVADVSPDGHRLAFTTGVVRWELAEIAVPGGEAHVVPEYGADPAWTPGGADFVYASNGHRPSIEESGVGPGHHGDARALVRVDAGLLGRVREAPDGTRVLFDWMRGPETRLMLANVSGSRPIPLDDQADRSESGVWSPDSRWIVYARTVGATSELVKARPGSGQPPEVLRHWPTAAGSPQERIPLDWSPDGQWILSTGNQAALFLVSAQGVEERRLVGATGFGGTGAAGFTHDGRDVLRIRQSAAPRGAAWQLAAIDVATGAERVLGTVDLPPSAQDVGGFSLSPDGTRILTSFATLPYEIWMLEGF